MHLPRNLFKHRHEWTAAHRVGQQQCRLSHRTARRRLHYMKQHGQLHAWYGSFSTTKAGEPILKSGKGRAA